MERISFVVTGSVQGVGFRYFTRRTAVALGVRGWVRNLESGQVEVEAEGSKEVLDQFLAACRKGPENSAVSKLDVLDRMPITTAAFDSFEIR